MSKGWSGPQAARIVGLTYRRLDYMARTNVVKPSLVAARGKGSRRGYSFRDLLALRTVVSIRAEGVSLQGIRRVQAALRHFQGPDAELDRVRLVLSLGRKPDVGIALSDEQAMSLLRAPGQLAGRYYFDLAPIVREVVQRVEKFEAAEGRRPRASRTRAA